MEWVTVGMMKFPMYGKIIRMFQITNQSSDFCLNFSVFFFWRRLQISLPRPGSERIPWGPWGVQNCSAKRSYCCRVTTKCGSYRHCNFEASNFWKVCWIRSWLHQSEVSQQSHSNISSWTGRMIYIYIYITPLYIYIYILYIYIIYNIYI